MSRALLKFVRVSPNKAAGIISKVIASAVANGEYEPEEVTITSCRVDKAAVMKRWRPRARGTASRIIKPTAHILVEVGTVSSETEAAVKKAESKKVESKKAESKKAAPKKEAAKKTEAKKTETKKVESKKAAPKAAAKSETKGDDLTKIAGIGKVYQGKLNDEGIFTYAEVVNMTQAQIDTMEEKYTFKGDFKDAIADAKNFVNGKDA